MITTSRRSRRPARAAHVYTARGAEFATRSATRGDKARRRLHNAGSVRVRRQWDAPPAAVRWAEVAGAHRRFDADCADRPMRTRLSYVSQAARRDRRRARHRHSKGVQKPTAEAYVVHQAPAYRARGTHDDQLSERTCVRQPGYALPARAPTGGRTPLPCARRSNRSRFMTLSHAATKSRTNFSCASFDA